MDSARLTTELTTARFGTTQFRQGYDMADVDRFIDEVVAAVDGQARPAGLSARVRAVRFSTTSLQRGYDMADVDTLLESVAATLEGEPTPQAGGAPAADATGAARPGVLARLLAAVRGDQPLR